ncbi:unnamed protein product, partial [Mesorhabditis belari]|uniref:N-acetyltransferase domain-containing protein n=1 Tax=Mesorhabditis belari TaxID=2138241 RepID=A0AAF3FH63_9BILA
MTGQISYGNFYVIETRKMKYWKQWFHMISEEGWTAYDRSVRELYPHWNGSHLAVALDEKDNHFLGCFVWCENDGIAAMDAYNVIKDAQGRGVGAALWDYTMNRTVPKNLTKAMRSLPERVDRYMKLGWSCKGPVQYEIDCSTVELKEACTSLLRPLRVQEFTELTFITFHSLSDHQRKALFEFDTKVTGRNRRKLWEHLLRLEDLRGGVVVDSKDRVVSLCLIVETFDDKLLRVAPLYGENLEMAMIGLIKAIDSLNDSTNSKRFHKSLQQVQVNECTLLWADYQNNHLKEEL